MKKIQIDDNWITEQYVDKLRSAQDISIEIGCSISVITRKLKKLNIALRSAAETTIINTSSDASNLYRNRDWLYDQYITQCKSLAQIGREIDCDNSILGDWLRKHGIEKRVDKKPYETFGWLYHQCITLQKSVTQVGRELGCSETTISKWAAKHNIPVVKWKGGIDTPERHKERCRQYYIDHGGKHFEDNPNSSLYLGVHIAERVLSNYFKNIKRMPIMNHGYDFICSNGFMIDVKSSTLYERNYWSFDIRRNDIANYFLCIAFDNREDLNPIHVWLIPSSIINNKYTFSIRNSEKFLAKWAEYEKPIDKVLECCQKIKKNEEN